MRPRLFIVDTNVLVAGLITARADSPTAIVLDSMLNGSLLYLLSHELLFEYRSVLSRPKLASAHGLDEAEIDILLTELTANALWREPAADCVHPAPDPQDKHLWALLACEPSAVLVTGDRVLLENPRPGSTVILPANFIQDTNKR